MTSDKNFALTVPSLKSVDVIRLVYEKFRPVTKSCGPLLAGEVSMDGEQGHLYLTEYQYWLWSSDTSAVKESAHPEVDALTTPQALVRSLLASTAGTIKAFEAHLDRIELRATDLPSMVGYYLSNDCEAVTDAIATESLFSLERPEKWKRIKESGVER